MAALPAHRAGDAAVGHQPLELLAGILAALIGVMQQGIGLAAPPDRHDQCIGDELGSHLRLHRPSDDTPREQVDHGRDIEPAFGGPDIGEVGHPFLVGAVRRELTVQHIASDDRAFALTPGSSGRAGL